MQFFTLPMYRVKLIRERGVLIPMSSITEPARAIEIAAAILRDADRECFYTLFLDTQHHIRGASLISMGTLDTAVLHPREVFKAAILSNTAAIICIHNHPSGDPAPSAQDRDITTQLCAVGRIVGIPVLDHLIIGENQRYYSFAESGMMPEEYTGGRTSMEISS